MDSETLWELFWATGLPEAAALAEHLRRSGEEAQTGKTA